MSDHAAPAESDLPPVNGAPETLFSHEDLQAFDDDDVKAGGNIGRMLAILFVYTLVAMSIAGAWTWSSLAAGE
jgi:hypothetical protein